MLLLPPDEGVEDVEDEGEEEGEEEEADEEVGLDAIYKDTLDVCNSCYIYTWLEFNCNQSHPS